MATFIRKESTRNIANSAATNAAAGLASAANSERAVSSARSFEARVLEGTSDRFFLLAAEQRKREADADAASFVFQRESVNREIMVDGQKLVVRDENAAVAPELPDTGSISIFDNRYRTAMQSRYVADVEVTTRSTMSKLAVKFQNDPEAFGSATEEYIKATQQSSPEAMRGVVTDTMRRVSQGVMSGLVQKKAQKDYEQARNATLSHIELLDSDIVQAFSAGADGQAVYRVGDETRVGSDSQLTASFRQIYQQWNQAIAAGFKTEADREIYFRGLGDRLSVAQVARGMLLGGELREANVTRAETIRKFVDGSLQVSVPTIDESGSVSFRKTSVKSIMDVTKRQQLGSVLTAYAGQLDRARQTRESLDNFYDSETLAKGVMKVLEARRQGQFLNDSTFFGIQQSLSSPQARAQWMKINAQADREILGDIEKAFRTNLGVASFEQAMNDYENMGGNLSEIGPLGDFIINNQDASPERLATLAPTMGGLVTSLAAAMQATERARAGFDAFVQRNSRGASQSSPWSKKDVGYADGVAAAQAVQLGLVGDVSQMTGDTWLENPDEAIAVMRTLPAAPPKSILDAMAGSVARFVESGDDSGIPAAVKLFRFMRDNGAYTSFIKGDNGLPTKVFNALSVITSRADVFGQPVTGPESQKRIASLFNGDPANDGLAFYFQQTPEWRTVFENGIRDKLRDGPGLSEYEVPPLMLRAVVEEVASSLSFFDNDPTEAINNITSESLGRVLQNSTWGKSPYVWNGGPAVRQSALSAVTGGTAGAWVQEPPSVRYRGLGIDEDQFAKWAKPMVQLFSEREGVDLELGKNAWLRPIRGERVYDVVYLDRLRNIRFATMPDGDPIRINFDSLVKEKLRIKEIQTMMNATETHKRSRDESRRDIDPFFSDTLQ